ncbi:MAG: AAA family ATPase [Bacteroidetes bacterium]|nr:AAA family ATPase [Bacteroidota bacterium]
MKITAIRGSNLASIEGEFDINFTHEPLKSAGIFAITGKTGAGKSTILDALCLALYGQTPRTTGNETVQITDAGKAISQNDARNILRRGCGVGYAEVEFEAVDNQCYRARYSIRRARQNPNAALQNYELQVIRLHSSEEEALSGTNSELQKQIVQLTGLTFQQFTRSVLLAQGDFATFLKAKDEERAELLEKLTGTEIYSKISIRIFENFRNAKQEYDLLAAGLQSIKEQILPEELHTQYSQECDEVQKNTAELELAKKTNEAHLQWLQRNDELQKTLQTATENYQKAHENLKTADARIAFLQKYDTVQSIATQYYNSVNCKQEIKQLEHAERAKKILLETQQKECTQAEQNEQQAQKTLLEVQQSIEVLQPELNKAKELDILLGEKWQAAATAQQTTKTAQSDYEKVLAELETQKTNVKNLQKQEIELQQWFEKYASMEHIVEHSAVIVQKIQMYKTETANLRSSEKQLKIAQNELNTSFELHKNFTQELLTYTKSCSLEVLKLRQQLQQGKPCAVCGSIVSHIPHEETNAELPHEELLQRSEMCKTKLEELTKHIAVLHEKIKQLSEQNTTFNNSCNEQKQTLFVDLQNYPEWENRIESGEIIRQIENLAAQWKQKQQQLQSLKLPEAQLQEENLQQRVKEKQANLHDAQSKEKVAVEAYKTLQNNRKLLLNNCATSTVEQEWSEKLKQALAAKDTATTQKSIIQKTINTTQGELQNIMEQCLAKQQQLRQAQEQINTWLQNQTEISTDELPVFFEKSAEWIAGERAAIQQLYTRKTETETAVELAKTNMETHEKTRNNHVQTVDKEKLTETIAELQEKITQCNSRTITLQTELLKHTEAVQKLAKQSAELTKKETQMHLWQKLSEVFGSADGKKFKKLAQAFTLNALIDDANYHLQMLSNRYRLGRIGDSLSLHVEDLDMGGEIRSVHSLSGGEAFLVSLALALGLSSLASDRLSIGSLFIDEGFGSLDIETLSCAMDALERLQATGRKIGVISHVSEMSERIACKIHVQKIGNGRSEIVVNG